MKSYEQRAKSIKQKASAKRKRNTWTVFLSVACILAICITLCSVPIIQYGPRRNISAYKSDSYFPLIEKINSSHETSKKSVFGLLADSLACKSAAPDSATGDNASTNVEDANKPEQPTDGKGYQETTLNQVNGVIEGDMLKRTDTHAFYLKGVVDVQAYLQLNVYKLDGENTKRVNSYKIESADGVRFYVRAFDRMTDEIFLSADGTTVTVIASCVNGDGFSYTCVITLDVSNVADIKETGRKYVSGAYVTSRKAGDKIIVITNYSVRYEVDYSDKKTFVPSCGDALDDYVSLDDIYIPSEVTARVYTVIAQIEEKTSIVQSDFALLSYCDNVMVSKDHIFVTRFNDCYYQNGVKSNLIEVHNNGGEYVAKTDIICLTYGEKIKSLGCVTIDGVVKNQYSMDELDGVLRVAATTRQKKYGGESSNWSFQLRVNADLYCIDLADMKILASVTGFAPEGEEVKSARFDGNTAYVCTAVANKDPVYAFDLSNLNDIKSVDSGEIDGFSISLIPFGGKLLGIGQNNDRLKIELYKATEDSVQSVAVYQNQSAVHFSQKHKAHFIDAEHKLVGLSIVDFSEGLVTDTPSDSNGYHNKYLLLQYDETAGEFTVVYCDSFDNAVDYTRAFYCGGGVYVIGYNGFRFISVQ